MFAPTFIKSAAARRDFPPDEGREVAFVGRSNSGKSSAINALLGARKLARVSKTPGRTRLINFFEVARDRRVVDLPGYGFARVPDAMREQWRRLLEDYFRTRQSLAGLVVTVDIRRGLAPLDCDLLAWIAPRALPTLLLLTKADKLSRSTVAQSQRTVRAGAGGNAVAVEPISALTGAGLAEPTRWLARCLELEGGGHGMGGAQTDRK